MSEFGECAAVNVVTSDGFEPVKTPWVDAPKKRSFVSVRGRSPACRSSAVPAVASMEDGRPCRRGLPVGAGGRQVVRERAREEGSCEAAVASLSRDLRRRTLLDCRAWSS